MFSHYQQKDIGENLEKRKLDEFLKKDLFFGFLCFLFSFGSNRPRNMKDLRKENKLAYNERIENTMTRERFDFIHFKFSLISKKDVKNGPIVKKPKILETLVAKF